MFNPSNLSVVYPTTTPREVKKIRKGLGHNWCIFPEVLSQHINEIPYEMHQMHVVGSCR